GADRFDPLRALAANVARAHRAALQAQHAFLDGSLRSLEGPANGAAAPPAPPAPAAPPALAAPAAPVPPAPLVPAPPPAAPPAPLAPPTPRADGATTVIWDEHDLLEFARGDAAP